ncbi:helix-turn-helix domain-containing protein [Rubrivirga sp.]|uniref:helix-turn-helix domain-containing protein n=1 Tax=Rubrivirga sp. TaxID=1885344 RepID=UPI003C74CC93
MRAKVEASLAQDLYRRAGILTFRAIQFSCALMLVPAATLHAAITGLAAVGIEEDALIKAAGLTRDQLAAPFAMAPVTAIEAVWARAAELDPRPELILRAGRGLPLGTMRVLDTLAVSAPTLGASLDDGIRLFRFATVTLHIEATRPTDALGEVSVEILTAPPFPRLPYGEAWALAVVISRMRAGIPDLPLTRAVVSPPVGRDLVAAADALGVDIQHMEVSDTHSGFSFPARYDAAPLRSSDPGLYGLISATAEQIIADAYGRSPLTFAIRRALPDAIAAGAFGVQDIAASLGLSSRSLQRHLAAEETSFRAVLDGHRHDAACRRLQGTRQSIGEIAAEVGYRDQAVFSRAFQRWTGTTPSAWRKANAPRLAA